MTDIVWVHKYYEPKIFNDVAAQIIRVNLIAWTDYGYHGENQIVGISDTGLDTGNSDTLHPDLRDRLLKAFAYGRENNWSDPDGHGTHVAGSVVGTGKMSDGQIKGMAYEAKIIFQSLLDAGGHLSGIDARGLYNILLDAYGVGARIHTNSWGADFNGYTDNAYKADRFIWDYKDMTVLFAAGN